MTTCRLLLTTSLLLMATAATAQTVTFERLADRLDLGDDVRVIDTTGREHRGRLVDLTPEVLVLGRGRAGTERLPRPDVREVWTRRADSPSNGAAIGFGGVAAAYCGLVAVKGWGGSCIVPAVLLGGIGAALGVVVDLAKVGEDVVFRSAPVTWHVVPSRGGAVVVLARRW